MATLGSTFTPWVGIGLSQAGVGAFGYAATDIVQSSAHFLNLGSGVIADSGASELTQRGADAEVLYQDSGTRFVHLGTSSSDQNIAAPESNVSEDLRDLAAQIQATPQTVPPRMFAETAEEFVSASPPMSARGTEPGDASAQASQPARWRAAIGALRERVKTRSLSDAQLAEREDIFGLLEGMVARYERLQGMSSIPAKDLDRISQRLEWNTTELPRLVDLWTDQYHEHFLKRLGILSNMILDVAADAHWESAQERFKVKFGKPLPIEAPPEEPEPADVPPGAADSVPGSVDTGTSRPTKPVVDGPRQQRGDRVEGLINHDVGLGIPLWRHQIEVLKKIQGAMSVSHESGFDPELATGYVVAATGSGKTRTMMASIAMALKEGWFDPRRGDKCVIATHLNVIHDQNEEAARTLLAPIFRQLLGRDVKVSTVGAGKGFDVSGDVVIVNVPAVGREDAIQTFGKELKRSLGSAGEIPLVVLDEVHHGEAGTWKRFREAVQEVSSHRYELGFTATPSTGMKGRRLANYPAMALIPEKVLPNVQLVPVETEINLDGLKTHKGDFAERELSQAVASQKRNRRIFEAMEQHGVTRTSPSGRLGFAPTLVFGVSLAHAHGSIARDYIEYFGEGATQRTGLRGRKLTLIGAKEGQWVAKGKTNEYTLTPTSYEETREAIERYRRGEIDGVVAVVWGGMPKRSFDLIMEAFEKGEIEAVINCKKLEEGYDAPFVRNIVGAKPTLKGIQKTQEVGRILRWNEGEVDFTRGIIREDNPRVAFDARDQFGRHGQVLWTYQEALGVIAGGRLAVGSSHDLRVLGNAAKLAGGLAESTAPSDLSPIVMRLKELLGRQYAGDVDLMAYDLGLGRHELAALININGLSRDRLFLEELATMLYLPREELATLRHDAFTPPSEVVIDQLERGLELYFGLEGKTPHTFTVVDARGNEQDEITVTPHLMDDLRLRKASELQVRWLALGLWIYFSRLLENGHAGLKDYVSSLEEKMDAAYTRLGWDASIHGLKEADTKGIVAYVDRKNGSAIQRGGQFYLVGQLASSGKIAGLQPADDVSKLSSHQFKLNLRRTDVGLAIEGMDGAGAFSLAAVLREKEGIELGDAVRAAFTSDYAAGDLRGKAVDPSKIDATMIVELWRRYEEAVGHTAKAIYLVGRLVSGKIVGLRPVEDVSEVGVGFCQVKLGRTEDGLVIEGMEGTGAFVLAAALRGKGGIEIGDAMRAQFISDYAAGVVRRSTIDPSKVDVAMISGMWQRYEEAVGHTTQTIHFVGRLMSGRITGLRPTEDVSKLGVGSLNLKLSRTEKGLVIESMEGNGSFGLVGALRGRQGIELGDAVGAAFASDYAAGDVRGRVIDLSTVDAAMIAGMWQRYEEAVGRRAETFCLVGVLDTSKITGLRPEENTSKPEKGYFKLQLNHTEKGLVIEGMDGTGALAVASVLGEKDGIELGDAVRGAFAADYAAGHARGKAVDLTKIDAAMISAIWKRYEDFAKHKTEAIHLVGQVQPSGNITGFRPVEDVSELGSNFCKVKLRRAEKGLMIEEWNGNGAFALVAALWGKENIAFKDSIRAAFAAEYAMGDVRHKAITPSTVDAAMISGMWQRYNEAVGHTAETLCLVGLLQSGKLRGLRLVEDASAFEAEYFKITLRRTNNGLVIDGMKGGGAFALVAALWGKEGIELAEALKAVFASDYAAGPVRGKGIDPSEIDAAMISGMWQRYEEAVGHREEQIYLVGFLQSGKITGLRPTKDVSKLVKGQFNLTLSRTGKRLVIVDMDRRSTFSLVAALRGKEGIALSATAEMKYVSRKK